MKIFNGRRQFWHAALIPLSFHLHHARPGQDEQGLDVAHLGGFLDAAARQLAGAYRLASRQCIGGLSLVRNLFQQTAGNENACESTMSEIASEKTRVQVNSAPALVTESTALVWLGAILVLGLALRLYQLGADNFWFDEFGVLQVVKTPSLISALQNSHKHIMAMPLDYAIAWFFAHFRMDEGFLRIPSALWGTASLVPCFFLFKRLSSLRTALLTTLLLALSPLHIQYSQELRFYASLLFFYLTSCWLFLWALEKPEKKRWALFTAVLVIGIYFHIFVILALVNCASWIYFARPGKQAPVKLYFVRSVIVILFALLLAVLFFGRINPENMPLTLDGEPVLQVISRGLGFAPFYPSYVSMAGLLGFLCLPLATIGILQKFKSDPRGQVSALFLSLSVQIAGIISLALFEKYFLAPRQFLIFHPFVLFFAAQGIILFVDWLQGMEKPFYPGRMRSSGKNSQARPLLSFVLVAALLLASVPALANYYRGDKGEVREILQRLDAIWQPGDKIYVVPDYNAYLFSYYANLTLRNSPISTALVAAGWEDLQHLAYNPGRQFLIAPSLSVESGSYPLDPVFIPPKPSAYSQSVWFIEKETP